MTHTVQRMHAMLLLSDSILGGRSVADAVRREQSQRVWASLWIVQGERVGKRGVVQGEGIGFRGCYRAPLQDVCEVCVVDEGNVLHWKVCEGVGCAPKWKDVRCVRWWTRDEVYVLLYGVFHSEMCGV